MLPKPVMLMILDGWGICEGKEGNAIAEANKPTYDKLLNIYPHAVLNTSGEDVGLPKGQMGNSEVGHMNIGAGRVVYQELTRINRAIRSGDFKNNEVLVKAIKNAAEDKALHFLGLLSDGGVHSHIEHLFVLLDMAKEMEVKEVYIHVLLDGRDVPPASAKEYIIALENKLKELGLGKIATVAGRYFTMDRDKRWDRVGKGYLAMVSGEGNTAGLALEAVEMAYDSKQTDEFVEPTVIVDKNSKPIGRVKSGDVMIMYNFRADRARQITHALTDKDFTEFSRPGGYLNLHYVCLTQYDAAINAPVAFPPQNLENTLGEFLSKKGLKQLRIAETEKYAHVTFFFNGGVEEPYAGEERILINSPKVATYNLQPEMSACQISKEVVKEIKDKEYDLIVLNYANPDMVGHTGKLDACVKAIETVDSCMGKVVQAVLDQGGAVIITADHGNAEEMLDIDSQQPLTAHTSNPVPIVLVDKDITGVSLSNGSLQDVAPTIIELMGLEKPEEMTGKSLIIKRRITG